MAEAIPGEFAGASLKPDRPHRCLDSWYPADPRRIRRGLIEALIRSAQTSQAARCRSIPGEFAGASLKRHLEAWDTIRVAGASLPAAISGSDPRRIRRGLIEARRCNEHRRSRSVRIDPRRIRRGLIEAIARSWSGPAMAVPAIPGEFAGASLKPPPSATGHPQLTAGPIPGEFAGASLKRSRAAQNSELPPRCAAIPGEFAGASLKRVRPRPCSPRRSPANSPGPH